MGGVGAAERRVSDSLVVGRLSLVEKNEKRETIEEKRKRVSGYRGVS